MSKYESEEDFFLNGFCLLCGNKTQEKYYSGTYDTYETCNCKHIHDFHLYSSKLKLITDRADLARDGVNRRARIVELKKELKQLEKKEADDRR